MPLSPLEIRLLDIIRRSYPIIEAGFEYEGDVYGKLNNDAIDVSSDIEAILQEYPL